MSSGLEASEVPASYWYRTTFRSASLDRGPSHFHCARSGSPLPGYGPGIVHDADDARDRHAGEIGERFLDHREIAGEQRTQDQPGCQLFAGAQMADQRTHLLIRRLGRKRDRCLVACLLGDALRAVLRQPLPGRNEIRQHLRQFRHQRLARRRRDVVTRQQKVADHGKVPITLDDAIERERRDFGIVVFQQHETGFGASDFGDGGRDRSRQRLAPGDCDLARRFSGRNRVDQIGVHEQRRTLENGAATSG